MGIHSPKPGPLQQICCLGGGLPCSREFSGLGSCGFLYSDPHRHLRQVAPFLVVFTPSLYILLSPKTASVGMLVRGHVLEQTRLTRITDHPNWRGVLLHSTSHSSSPLAVSWQYAIQFPQSISSTADSLSPPSSPTTPHQTKSSLCCRRTSTKSGQPVVSTSINAYVK